LGSFLGNVVELGSHEWLDFLAAFAAIVLTFLAGAEVDPRDSRHGHVGRLARRPLIAHVTARFSARGIGPRRRPCRRRRRLLQSAGSVSRPRSAVRNDGTLRADAMKRIRVIG
jgi:hypothetical protein